MFAYCGNNPVNYIDPTGNLLWAIVGAIVVAALIISIPSSENQTPYLNQAAREKYNANTVNVYMKDVGDPVDDMLNVEVYVANKEKDYLNIHIEDSLTVESVYEMNAVLDVVVGSDYYSEDRFGSRDFMVAQWIAHNACYDIASGSSIGFGLMRRVSGSVNPIDSSKALDIRNIGNMGRTAEKIYMAIAWAVP